MTKAILSSRPAGSMSGMTADVVIPRVFARLILRSACNFFASLKLMPSLLAKISSLVLSIALSSDEFTVLFESIDKITVPINDFQLALPFGMHMHLSGRLIKRCYMMRVLMHIHLCLRKCRQD
jgi:hypothetical protein